MPSGSRMGTQRKKLATFALLILFLFIFYVAVQDALSIQLQTALQRAFISNGDDAKIPNIVHFVYLLPDGTTDLILKFSHFLSIYSAWHHLRPDQIYLHTNVNNVTISRSIEDNSKKEDMLWTRYAMKGIPVLTLNRVRAPTRTKTGVEIVSQEHKSDFVRVEVVYKYGGVYMDLDVHALRDVTPLRRSGFAAIVGRMGDHHINSGVFMASRGSSLLRQWMVDMHTVYNGEWLTHSDRLLTQLSAKFVSHVGEVLILDDHAFSPVGYVEDETSYLFTEHAIDENDDNSNASQHDQDSPSAHPKPGWMRDWSSSYVLHAFNPDRHGRVAFRGITPEFVKARTSNFAHAVFPVVKDLLDRKII